METLLRRLLGLYFVVLAFASVPSSLAFLGVDNSFGPRWVLPLVPLAQALIFLIAGLILLRRPSVDAVSAGSGVVFPPLDALLQLVGVYFIVTGLASVAEPAVSMLFVSEAWIARVGQLAAAAVLLVGGWILMTRPQAVLRALTRHSAT